MSRLLYACARTLLLIGMLGGIGFRSVCIAQTVGVRLWEHANYQGTSRFFSYSTSPSVPDLDISSINFADVASSIEIFNLKSVVLYDQKNYGTPSITVTEDTPNLSTLGFNDRVGSLRLVPLDIPPRPTGLASLSITTTSFSLIWSASTGATEYRLDISTSSSFSSFVSGYNNKDVGNTLTTAVTGLAAGTQYYCRVKASNPGGVSSPSTTVPVLTLPPAPVATSATAVSDTAFVATWTSATGASGYEIDVASNTGFTPCLDTYLEKRVGNVLESQVRGLSYMTTYYYRVRAYNATGKSANSARISVKTTIPPLPDRVRVADAVAFPESPSSSTQYRLVSIPGMQKKLVGNVVAGLGDQKYDWRAYRETGLDFQELAAADTLGTGEGMWLIRKNAFTFADSIQLPTLDAEGRSSVGIHSAWNIVANPYNKPVTWTDILAANPSLPSTTILWGYAGTWSAASVLEPLRGYYFANGIAGLTTLTLPYPFGVAKVASTSSPEIEWSVRLTVESEINRDADNTIGVSPSATFGRDLLDQPKPPLLFDQTFLYFNRTDWDERLLSYASDFRPAVDKGQAWDFEVSNPRLAPTKITIEGVEGVPREHDVVLLNLSNTASLDLRARNELAFTPAGTITKFRLLVGSSQFVQEQQQDLVPLSLFLDQNYPNPFNPSTTIRFTLPAASNVELAVFNALGQKIVQLVEGRLGQGYHEVRFDGAGRASGVYIYRLRVGSQVQTRKLVLLR